MAGVADGVGARSSEYTMSARTRVERDASGLGGDSAVNRPGCRRRLTSDSGSGGNSVTRIEVRRRSVRKIIRFRAI